MNARSFHRTSRTVACLIALVVAALPSEGQQSVAIQPPSPTELRTILENQPDFTADGISRDPKGTQEVNIGRVARRGSQYRIDPAAGTLGPEVVAGFELLVPGSYGVMNFTPDVEASTFRIVQTKERRYHEFSAYDDDIMEVYPLAVVHPHVLLLVSAVVDERKPALEYLGEASVDGHPCVKFASDSPWGGGRTTYYAARDLRNLVVRIEWKMPSTGNLPGDLFPLEGVTLLRNVKLEAAAELFTVPRGFAKVDRAMKKAKEEADRQKRLHSADGAPRFYGVTVDPPVVRPGTIAKVSVAFGVASSEIKLTFMWKPDVGRIIGTGQQVQFDATGLAEGEYGVTFEVTDNYGHAPYVGRVHLKVREAVHDLSEVQTPSPSASFEQVRCAVEDRAGGWFVGGEVEYRPNQARQNVIHLFADGTLDPTFSADTTLVSVDALALGESTLYAAGTSSRGSGLIALDAKTGAQLPWDPLTGRIITTIAIDGRTLYASGPFESVGGEDRPYLAAFDVVTAKVLPWNPKSDGPIDKVLVAGKRLFVVGDFNSIAGRRQTSMAIFDIATGKLLDFDVFMYPIPSSISVVGDIVYFVAGSEIGAFDVRSGRRLDWNPTVGGRCLGIAATGGTVYVVGDFSTVGGRIRPQIAAIDAKTGAVTDWDPEADSHSWVIIPSGGRVFVGGNFETIGRQRRSKFAVLDAKTGDALPGSTN